ncbi:tetratricopeptide repeat protein [Desulfonatronum parangueonense]
MKAEEKKKIREHANRARRSLLNEKKKYGYINDGSGKRYRVGVFYVLSGDLEKALEFYSWFEQEFPDDIGEPIFDLYWALAYYRSGNIEKARTRLQSAMIQNIYMLPYLFHEPVELQEIWHSSNLKQPEYLLEVEEFLDEPTVDERKWMKNEFFSKSFEELRTGYIATYKALFGERDIGKRRKILDDWRHYEQRFFE